MANQGTVDKAKASEVYIVVLEGTGAPGSNHSGIRTWMGYESKTAFDAVRADRMKTHQVIAEGVNCEEAIALCDQMSEMTRVAAGVKELARSALAGEVYMMNVLFSLHRNPQSELRLSDLL